MTPDQFEYPDFDDNLRQSMIRETELFFDDMVRGNHPVNDLLTADYTFMNDRLAEHYGVRGVYGAQFRRVTLHDANRFGLLGHASLMTVNSYANRTSPVLRGKFVLTSLLGTPPAPPLPDVPPFMEDTGNGKPRSVRERLESHTKSATCAACHLVMDPFGFALENYDGIGRWRATENAQPVQSATSLVDGTRVSSPAQLHQWLTRQPDQFARAVTEKLMEYALGRPPGPAEMPAVRAIVRSAGADHYRLSSLLYGIVSSRPFLVKSDATPMARKATVAANAAQPRGATP